MAGTAEREIIGPQTPPCEIQSRQAAILPEPNDVTPKKWWVVSRPRISNSGITIESYSHHSCTQTGSISVVIDVWLIWLMRFVYCLSQSRDKKWKIKAAPDIKLLHLFILTAGTMLYFVRCCKCNVISFASFVLIRMRKLEQAIFLCFDGTDSYFIKDLEISYFCLNQEDFLRRLKMSEP